MTPEIADAARDVLALVRAALRNDTDATVALVLSLNREEACQRLNSMALLTAQLMRSAYGEDTEEYMNWFTRTYLLGE
jgi:hypothetical protein